MCGKFENGELYKFMKNQGNGKMECKCAKKCGESANKQWKTEKWEMGNWKMEKMETIAAE